MRSTSLRSDKIAPVKWDIEFGNGMLSFRLDSPDLCLRVVGEGEGRNN